MAQGNPFALAYTGQQHNLYLDVNRNISDIWYDGTSWHCQNLNSLVAGAPMAQGNPFGVVYTNQQHNLYLDVNGTISDIWYDGSIWHYQNLNSLVTGAPLAQGSPFVVAYTGQQHHLYLDVNGNISDIWYDGSNWHYQDLNTLVTGAPVAQGNPFSTVYTSQQHNLYLDVNFTISDIWYDGSAWHYQNLNSLVAGAPLAQGDPFCVAYEGQQHNLYLDVNGNISDIWYDGSTWHYQNLNGFFPAVNQMLMVSTGFVYAPFINAYNLLSSDISLTVMVQPQGAGTIVSTCSLSLVLNSDGSLALSVFKPQASQCVFAHSETTTILNSNQCHIITCISPFAGQPSIYLDGQELTVTCISGGRGIVVYPQPDQPLTIGAAYTADGKYVSQYTGGVMNVGLWSAVIPGDKYMEAGYGEIGSVNDNLIGYWYLDGTYGDASINNNPLQENGTEFSFMACFNCIVLDGPNAYSYCEISNDVQTGPAKNITFHQRVLVRTGSPALFASVVDNSGYARFPAGVFVKVEGPDGTIYDTDQSPQDGSLFVKTQAVPGYSANSLFALLINNPHSGTWKITITAPSTTAFTFRFQAVPDKNLVSTLRQSTSRHFQTSGWMSWVGNSLIVIGAVLIIAAPFTGPLLPAVAVAGLAIGIGGEELVQHDDSIPEAAATLISNPLPAPALANYSTWLSTLPDATSIGAINLPGTHDSAAIKPISNLAINAFSCQDATITQQLDGGIRVLDIRLKVKGTSPGFTFRTCHSDNLGGSLVINEYKPFKSLLDECNTFLTTNDQEFIVMSLKIDDWNGHKNDTDKPYVYAALTALLNLYPVFSLSTVNLPTLGSVRGKIYLLNRITDDNTFGIPLPLSSQDNTNGYLFAADPATRNYEIYAQDHYNFLGQFSGIEEEKFNRVTGAFSHLPAGGVLFNFASAIKGVNQRVEIKDRLVNYFGNPSNRPTQFGWTLFDFPFMDLKTDRYGILTIVKLIVASNNSYSGFTNRFTIVPFQYKDHHG